jgi:hypothetical protein
MEGGIVRGGVEGGEAAVRQNKRKQKKTQHNTTQQH